MTEDNSNLDLSTIDLDPALVLVVPALLIIGYALKKTPKCPDWLIVWIILLLGTVAGLISVGLDVNGFANGLIAGGLAIASNQVYVQTKKRKK